jgi:hypothetical protein
MAKLPKDVESVKRALSRDPPHDLSAIAAKLMANTSELAAMWKALEKRRCGADDFWVWGFLRAAANASNLPPYHYMTAQDRRDLSDKILGLAKDLVRALEVNGLDAHLVHNDGKIFNGYFLYEDFGESNRTRFDIAGASKLKASELISRMAERSKEKINEEPIPGKNGPNARAIRFVRLIAARNKRNFDQPLNAVTAAAANAVFGTSYAASDIKKLLSR